MESGKSDPLADTATAVPTEPMAPPTTGGIPKSIGRYTITALLGQGGMGVVYAAHDPDLERPIALKVLLAVGSEPARARLLREARAMAKLSHPAVVTVYEVASAGNVDFVAMELIDGSTLGEWIAKDAPSQREILDAFEIAGRGVASAHAAGLIHRDFKPHNVLRSKAGRVVVTDFGLARASLDAEQLPDASAEGSASGTTVVRANKSAGSLSSTLTATGAVLGTPAYMSPEQHDGTAVGPAADQFAYCVALWESLARARPFSGPTLGELRKQIDRGPDPTTEANIPRRLRAPLRRGLSVDPRARFASMDALLAAIHRRGARAWLALVPIAIAVVGTIVLVERGTATPPTPPPTPPPAALAGCGDPDVELAAIAAAPVRAKLSPTPHGARLLDHIDGFAGEWRGAQRSICAHPEDKRHEQRVTCLRVVRDELQRILTALDTLTPAELADAEPSMGISDPLSCTVNPRPPDRVVIEDPEVIAISAAANGNPARRLALAEPAADKPCLRGMYFMARLRDYATLPYATITAYKSGALEASDRCPDDRFGASVTVLVISTDVESAIQDPSVGTRIDAAIARSGGDRTLAILRSLVDGVQAQVRADYDGAIADFTSAAEVGRARGVDALGAYTASASAALLVERGAPGDVDRAEALLRPALELVGPTQRAVLQRQLFQLVFSRGKTADAMAIAAAIVEPPPSDAVAGIGPAGGRPGRPAVAPIDVRGTLVDEAGAPVAGARVVAGTDITFYDDALDPIAPAAAVATTAADGSFSIQGVAKDAWVVAALGARQAMPVPASATVRLALHATGAASGRVVATTPSVGTISIGIVLPASKEHVTYTSALAADRAWHVAHVPTGAATLDVQYAGGRRHQQAALDIGPRAGAPLVTEIAVRGKPIHVVVRSQLDIPLSRGFVWLVRGKVAPGKVVHDLESWKGDIVRGIAIPARPDSAPVPVRSTLRGGDAITELPAVEPGEVSVCAIGASGNFNDPEILHAYDQHSPDYALTCVPVTVSQADQVVVVEVPPPKRFE